MDDRPRKRKRHGRVPGEDVSVPEERQPAGLSPVPVGPRDDKAPADSLDAQDRSEARRMIDDEAAERWNRLEWHRTLRWLVAVGGLLGILAVIALLVQMLGGDPADPIVMILTAMASAISGYAVKRWRGGP
jgi:hypothetical protein